jgi:L-lactate dehydrogenase (cytochrome)
MPIYITATALGKLGHPDGEVNLTRAAGKFGLIQMIPTLASCSFDELMDAAKPGQVQFLQLYVNKDREKTKRLVQHAEKRGIKGLFITVDAPQLGRREKDMRMKFEDEGTALHKQNKEEVDRSQGAARAISSFIDPGLSWKDLAWFKSITKMPIILKGVQCWEDAVMAVEAGCQGIVLSNHGGRQLEFARSGIEVLVEVVAALRERHMFPNPNFEIYVDGGVRRATDVLKAIALGATAVGIGRPFLYAYSTYGQEGIDHALKILNDEFEMNMRLLGAQTIKDIVPAMVDASSIHSHVSAVPSDRLYENNYESMLHARMKAAELKAKAKL